MLDLGEFRNSKLRLLRTIGVRNSVKFFRLGQLIKRHRRERAEHPVNLRVETTNRCNLKCTFCPRSAMKRAEGDMDFSMYKSMMDGLKERKSLPFSLCLHNDGEPTLNDELPRFIKYAKDAGVRITYLNTNGTMLNDGRTREILASGLDMIIFSVEATREIHERTRVGSDYDAVTDNLTNLMEQRHDGAPVVRISMVAMPGVTSQEDLRSAFRMWSGAGAIVDVSPQTDFAGQLDIDALKPKPPHCDALWEAVVLHNGDVVPCCMDFDGRLVMGNVNDEPLMDIWNSRRYVRFLKSLEQNDRDQLPPLCRNCLGVVR